MPRKISQIDLKNRSQITNSYQVVCTNPLNFELARVPATQFRGAGLFTSKNDPTLTPENPIINEYIDGDIYVQDTERGQEIYFWNSVDSVWDKSNRLNGIRLLSATDFPDEIDLDVRGSDFISDLAYENDYYLNKTLNLIYGAYNPALGFRFGSIDFSGYMSYRPPVTHTFAGDDVIGYDDPKAYLDRLLTDQAATAKDKLTARHPTHGDTVHITLENDEGHGGWVYYFSTDNEATGTTLLENYNIFLGTNVAGDQPIVKKHFREEKTWNEAETPVQNDKKYRQGDNVLTLSTGVLYYNYQEGQPENTTDLGLLFEGSTVLKGSSLKSSQDVNGNWVSPTADDNKYQRGDFVLTKDLGTPRIHGPYVFGAGNDLTAWPIFAILRQPYEHVKTDSAYTAWTSFEGFELSQPYPVIDDVMVVDGDTIREVFTENVKEYLFKKGCKVTINPTLNGANNYIPTVDWQRGFKTPIHAARISTSTSLATPSVDHTIYYDGEIVRNKIGEMYSFVENYEDQDNSSFDHLEGLRAVITHFTTQADGNYTPPRDQNSTDWGGASVVSGDTLQVTTGAGDAKKVVLYTAKISDVDAKIDWEDRRNKFGQKLWQISEIEHPPATNNNLYTEGDRVISGSGIEYIYREDVANSGASPSMEFYNWRRSSKTYLAYGNDHTTSITSGVVDYGVTFGSSLSNHVLKVGDILRYEYRTDAADSATSTGKVKEKIVTKEFPVKLGDWYNPNPTRIWSGASAVRNNRDDTLYSDGDFIDNGLTEWRYGPYVEGASDNLTAWPDFRELLGTEKALAEHNPNKFYAAGSTCIKGGDVYSANSTITGDQSPVAFVEGTGVDQWTLKFKGGGRLIDKDDSTKRPELYVKNGLLVLDRTS